MNTTSIRKRIIAFTLSAVTVFGACAPALSITAQAAEKQAIEEEQAEAVEKTVEETVETTAKETVEETEEVKSVNNYTPVALEDKTDDEVKAEKDPANHALEFVKDCSFETAVEACRELIPHGKVYAPLFKSVLSRVYGKKSEMSLGEINENINGLYSKIDQASKQIKSEIQGMIPISNFDYGFLTPLNSQIKGIASSIQRIREDDRLNPIEKLVMIASKLGRENEWNDQTNVLQTMSNVTDKLNDSSLVRSQNMFQCIYNYYVKERMFSAEAKADARPIVDNVMKHYMSAYAVLIDVLVAQKRVNDLINEVGIDEVKKHIDSYYLDRVCKSQSEIQAKITELTDAAFGSSLEADSEDDDDVADDSVYGKYVGFQNIKENIFVNKGKNNIELNQDAPVSCRHTDKSWLESKTIFKGDRVVAQQNFNKYYDETKRTLSPEHLKDLAEYTRSKNTTIREVLKGAGFNVDSIPQNGKLVSSKADNDWNIGDVFTTMVGTNVQHVFIKGYNIDEKNPTEQKYNIWEQGHHAFGIDSWSFAGNVDALFFC